MAKTDLNLMEIFEAIYDEQSISRAGDSLCLSQSAVSHSLSRLRDIYKDPLFIRQGNKMKATALTERVIVKIKNGLKEIRSSIDDSESFDVTGLNQSFTLGMRDLTEIELLPRLMESLGKVSSGINLVGRQVRLPNIETELTVGKLDICVETLIPHGPTIKHTRFLQDRLVVIGKNNHRVFNQSFSLTDLLQYRHILVTVLEHEPEIMDKVFSEKGLQRNIALRCQNTLSAVKVLLNSDYLSFMPYSTAVSIAQFLPIRHAELPFEVPQIEAYLYWHKRNDTDPAHTWLRQKIIEVVDQISSVKVIPDAIEWVKRDR